MFRVGAKESCDSELLYFGFLWKSHTFPYTISPPLTTQCARTSAILTQISGNDPRNILAQAHCAFILVLTGKKPNSTAISDDISDVLSKPMIHCWLKIVGLYSRSPSIPSAGLAFTIYILLSDRKQSHVTVTVSLLLYLSFNCQRFSSYN